MKKLLLGVITFALIITSCNKYADDFQELKDSIAALDAKVAGVATLQTSLTAVTAQITALQTAVAGLPTTASITTLTNNLAAVATKVDGLTTTLNTVATTGTATKGVVDALAVTLGKLVTDQAAANLAFNTALAGLKTDLGKAATKDDLTAAQTAILNKIIANSATTDQNVKDQIDALKTALEADINAGGTTVNDKLDALNALVTSSNATQTATINATIAALISDPNGDTATSNTIKGLQLALAAAKSEIDIILANTSMYNGDVNITSDAEVTFFMGKLGTLGIVNGNVNVNPALISAANKTVVAPATMSNVNTILSKIQAVIGTGNVSITSVAADAIALPILTSVGGSYSVTGANVLEPVLSSIKGNLTFNFDGPYDNPSITTVGGNLTLTKVAKVAGTTVGTTLINMPAVNVVGTVSDGVNAPGTLVYPDATSIILSGGVTNLTGAVATQITLGSAAYPAALTISAPTAGANVNLSAATSNAGLITVTTGNGGVVNLSKLASTAGGVNINTGTSGTVDFSALASAAGGVTLAGPATVSFPVLVSGLVTSDATTVTMAKHEWTIPAVLSKVVTLTLGNVNASVNLDSYNTTLVTATISGKAQTTWAATTGNVVTTASAKLTTLTLGGNLASANLVGLTKLTSLTTSGVVNSLTVDGASVLTAMNLGHTYYQPGNVANGGPGSDLVIKNNPLLTALKSSTDYPRSIDIESNAKLASIDLSSYQTKLLASTGANTTITINTNALVGDYTNAIAITPTTPYAETVIKSADLAKLKAFIASYPATGFPTLTLAINIDKVTLGGVAGNALLSARMGADAAHTMIPGGAPFNFGAPATGITLQKEFTLVQ